MNQLKEGMWWRHRHLLLFGKQLPFATEEATSIFIGSEIRLHNTEE